jgi:flagellar P-ring protein precursor FlgI
MGNAKSLRGGTLLLTPIKGADGRVYAMSQGNLVVSGAGASQGGSSVQVNHLSAGRIPGGATIERNVPTPLLDGDYVQLELHTTDFSTVRRLAEKINHAIGPGMAQALDGRVVRVAAPRGSNERVGFLAQLEDLSIEMAAAPAKVIINARTGSVVMNQSVRLEPSAVAHGSLSVVVDAAQPELGQGADIQVKQDGGSLMNVKAGANLADVVKALNALGANPLDLLAILQAMKAAGALRADLEVI